MKIIQIAANEEGIFGLDDEGSLYFMHFKDTLGRAFIQEWEKLPAKKTIVVKTPRGRKKVILHMPNLPKV